VTTNTPSGQPFTNVYLSSTPTKTGTGKAIFNVKSQPYAVCGTSPQNLGSAVTCVTSDYEPVVLTSTSDQGTNCLTYSNDGGFNFVSPNTATISVTGSYGIKTDSDFVFPDPLNRWSGLGAEDPNDPTTIIPVATFAAHPALQYYVTPVVKYYICTGTYVPGQIIDVTAIGVTASVDFTGSPYRTATFTHQSNGTYTGGLAATAANALSPYLPPLLLDARTGLSGGDSSAIEPNDMVTISGYLAWTITGALAAGTVAYITRLMSNIQTIHIGAAAQAPGGYRASISLTCLSSQAMSNMDAVERVLALENQRRTPVHGENVQTRDPVRIQPSSTVSVIGKDGTPRIAHLREGTPEHSSIFGHRFREIQKQEQGHFNSNGNSNGYVYHPAQPVYT